MAGEGELDDRVVVAAVTPRCRRVTPQGAVLAQRGDAVAASMFGGSPERTEVLACPEGQLAVGLFGRAGEYVDEIGLVCAALEVSQTESSRTFIRGELTRPGTVGGEGGRAFQLLCPEGSILFGVSGRSGAVVDALGVRCGAADLAP